MAENLDIEMDDPEVEVAATKSARNDTFHYGWQVSDSKEVEFEQPRVATIFVSYIQSNASNYHTLGHNTIDFFRELGLH